VIQEDELDLGNMISPGDMGSIRENTGQEMSSEEFSKITPLKKVAHRKQPLYKYLLATLDWVAVSAALLVSLHVKPVLGIDWTWSEVILWGLELVFVVGFGAGSILIIQSNRLYKINVALSIGAQIWRVAKAMFFSAMVLLAIGLALLVVGIEEVNLLVPVYFFVAGFVLLSIARVGLFRGVFLLLARHNYFSRSILVLGVGPTAKKLADSLGTRNAWGFRIAGFLDNEISVGTEVQDGLRVLGNLSEVTRVVEELDVDEVVVCLEHGSITFLLDLLNHCAGTRALVRVASSAYNVIPAKMFQESYGDVPVVGVKNFTTTSYAGLPFMKRAVDIAASLFAIVLHAPLMAGIAIAIKLTSRGPILYKQIRIGKDGKPFEFYKFRSMYVGADKDRSRETKYASLIKGTYGYGHSSNPTKIVDDSKVTSIGRFIRKTSLDEFPQLFNVLKGDMSLVGPRPCLPYEWKHYDEWHKNRLSVTPGCTGMWQVLGRSEVGFQDMVILDLFYSQNISFHLDMWLVLKTIPVMVFGRGGK
jgi:undecaprenyl-phosphate galactose phosphotransferase